ncbi:MAG TPA: hypothetical protein DDX91_00780 [Ruminococcaceae bacterium]|nr:hypothetical protein [Oscillospiraceae bacterium]
MTEENVNQLIEGFEKIEELLKRYIEATNTIMATESEDISAISGKVQEREQIIGQIDFVKKQCTALIDSGEPEEAAQIREMLIGSNINQHIAADFIGLRNAIVSLRSAQSQAAEKDKALQTQFSSRANEAKEELVKLKDDKKKLDYYTSANSAPSGVGGSLDSSF